MSTIVQRTLLGRPIRPQIRGRCSVCCRDVATHVPKGGDGSARVAHNHRATGEDALFERWCPGSGVAVEGWE